MVDPLEELIRQSTEFHAQMVADNNELDRAFQAGTFGKLVSSWGNEDGGSDDGAGDSLELEGKNSSNVVEGESGGTSGGTETDGQTV